MNRRRNRWLLAIASVEANAAKYVQHQTGGQGLEDGVDHRRRVPGR